MVFNVCYLHSSKSLIFQYSECVTDETCLCFETVEETASMKHIRPKSIAGEILEGHDSLQKQP